MGRGLPGRGRGLEGNEVQEVTKAKARAPRTGKLFQEDLLTNPFWMLVACQLVNLTNWDQARPVLEEIRRRWPSPYRIITADPDKLQELLRPLGLYRRRTSSLRALARHWVDNRPSSRQDVLRLPGCGPYAADSWAIFVEGRRDVTVTDGKLAWYLEQVSQGAAR